MTELSRKVKTALDETRMLVLGAQILTGFQFRVVFQDAFDQLPGSSRALNAVALVLMLSALALLVAPSMHHRIVEEGRDTGRIHRVISTMADLALLPIALSLGIDIFIALARIYGGLLAVLGGASFGALALLFWYGLEFLRMRRSGGKERAMAERHRDAKEETPLHVKIEQMLTEARVILPGAQALLGFQLTIIITEGFDKLPQAAKLLHVMALGLIALTTILLMAPAAYHRIVYAGEDSESFHRRGSRMVSLATVPLALGLGCDVFVVLAKTAQSEPLAALVAALATMGFVGLWHVYPLLARYQRSGAFEKHQERGSGG
jgi:Family of unknown function (DUF6328)